MNDRRWLARAIGTIVRHPSLWWTAVVQALRLAAPGWWKRPPHLPVPSTSYVRFRVVTMYGGDGERLPDPSDLVTYLRWCREMANRP